MSIVVKHIHWFILLLIPIGIVKYAFLLHQVIGLDWNLCIFDTSANAAVMALSIWSIILLIKSYPTKVTAYTYSVVLALILGVGSVFTVSSVLKWGLKLPQNATYMLWLQSSLPFRFIFFWLVYSWVATNTALRKNINALNIRFQQQTDAQTMLREAELFKLRQQLQPHFLYNSLNSISALIMVAPDSAQEMIGKLSDFLRGSVRREAEDNISIEDELIYIESYLAIESVRFGDRLQVTVEKNDLSGCTIPPFLFQPILENAIKFGLYGKTGIVNITIQITQESGILTLKITNPYDANSSPPKGTGFGLSGVARRLFLLFSRTDLLETEKDDHLFTTILKIPQHV